MTPAQIIKQHAELCHYKQGKIEVGKPHYNDGCYEAIVIITTAKHREYFKAWTTGGAVGMVRDRTELLPELPLFEV